MESLLERLQRSYCLRKEVVALPQLTEFFHELDNPEKNVAMYRDVFQGRGFSLREIESGLSLKLYDTAVALLDEREDARLPIVYLYLFKPGSFHGKKVCFEKYLWKDEGEWSAQRVEGLRIAQFVFFHLVDHFHAVVSDQKHTAAGARWWQDTTKKAISLNLDVLAANTSSLQRIENVSKLEKFVSVLWGTEPKFAERRIVVAKKSYLK